MKKIKQIIEFIQDLKYCNTEFLFAWYDLWVGIFFDKKKYWLYILPLPTVGIIIKFQSPQERDSDLINKYMRELTKEEALAIVEKHLLPTNNDVKIYLHGKTN